MSVVGIDSFASIVYNGIMIKQQDHGWGIVVCARVPREEAEALGIHAERAGLPHVGDIFKAIIHDWYIAQKPLEPETLDQKSERRR